MTQEITGKCLCGAVTYQAAGPAMVTGHCYCEDCRRTSGTSHCTHVMVSEDGFLITGDLAFFDKPADSGNMISRGFCPTCGSPVLSRNSAEMFSGMVFLRASSMDDMNLAQPSVTVYAAKAPDWAIVDQEHTVFPYEAPSLAEGKLPT